MKKLLLFFITVVFLFISNSCSDSNNEQLSITPKLHLKLSYLPTGYKFDDFNVKIYKNKENYNNETSSIFSGKFNANGEIEINSGIEKETLYYIDVFSSDGILNNWGSNKPVGSTEFELIQTEYSSPKIIDVILLENRKLIGTWNFLEYPNHNYHKPHDLTIRKKLIINKDLSIISYEEFNNVTYKLKYEITNLNNNSCDIKFISSEPNLDLYPFADEVTLNPNGVSLIIFINNSNKTKIEFRDYAQEIINYKIN